MAKYALIFRNDGTLLNPWAYTEETWPPTDIIYDGQTLVEFDDTSDDFDILWKLFFNDDPDNPAPYLTPGNGGVTYNFNNNSFEFHAPQENTFNLVDFIRAQRNELLKQTDIHALVPDYPDGHLDQVVAYRAALRDITKNINPSWKTPEDVVWPTPPAFI